MPRIVLHVGAPKTGSTYIQLRLRADPVLLRSHGIYVPVLPMVDRIAGNAKLLGTALMPRPPLSFARAFPEIDTDALEPAEILHRLLADWQPAREVALLSGEEFRREHAARLRALIPADVECLVVLCIRRQDRWIESYHHQLVKVDEIVEGLSSFVTRTCAGDDARFYQPDWGTLYDAWSAAFGNCRIVFYDEARTDLFAAVMHASELTVPAGLTDLDPVKVSPDVHQLAYLLALERPIAFEDFVRRRTASAVAARRLPPVPPRSLLSIADRARLHDRFDASNRRLMETLGRSFDDSPLAMRVPDPEVTTLGEIYASDAYIAHRELTDKLLATGETPGEKGPLQSAR
jgi:hypothetical protein